VGSRRRRLPERSTRRGANANPSRWLAARPVSSSKLVKLGTQCVPDHDRPEKDSQGKNGTVPAPCSGSCQGFRPATGQRPGTPPRRAPEDDEKALDDEEPQDVERLTRLTLAKWMVRSLAGGPAVSTRTHPSTSSGREAGTNTKWPAQPLLTWSGCRSAHPTARIVVAPRKSGQHHRERAFERTGTRTQAVSAAQAGTD
jgi:hypothetical protein